MLVRDFNEILSNDEKNGGQTHPEKQMEDFWQAIVDCELRDLGFLGTPFTRSNGREGENLVCECLDRCIANLSWCDLFPKSLVTHGATSYSAHIQVWLCTVQDAQIFNQGVKPFRFESMWVGHDECNGIIEETWDNKVALGKNKHVKELLNMCGKHL